jgi:putative tricarboxylic transport membrane protein
VRRGRQLACLGLFGLFLATLITSLSYSLTDALGPGPGFFPFWLSLIGAVLAAAIFIQDLRSGDAAPLDFLSSRRSAWQGGAVLFALVAAAALMEPLGFRLTMLAFVAAVLLALGARSLTAITLTSMAGSFGVFHVFFYWLKVPLPVGALGI